MTVGFRTARVSRAHRLDMVRTIRFTLYALQRSVSGWMEWINNPDIMAAFSLGELKEISKNLAKLAQPFVEYDCKITSNARKDLAIREPKKRGKDKSGVFYIK